MIATVWREAEPLRSSVRRIPGSRVSRLTWPSFPWRPPLIARSMFVTYDPISNWYRCSVHSVVPGR
jgi:hypothetical protein